MGGFNRFPKAKNLGNKKKFAQIGQYIHKISQKPFSGTQGGSGAQKRVKECPKKKWTSKFGFSTEKWVGIANKINLGTKFARDYTSTPTKSGKSQFWTLGSLWGPKKGL